MFSIIIFIFLITIFLTLLIITKGKYDEYLVPLDKKEYKLKGFIPLGLLILELVKYKYTSKYDLNLINKYSEIFGKKFAKYHLKIHLANKIVIFLIGLLFIFFINSIVGLQKNDIKTPDNISQINGEINRPRFGEEDKIKQLQVELLTGNVKKIEDFQVQIKAMPPITNDEKLISKVSELLTEDFIKGKNKDLSNTCFKLMLPVNDEKLGGFGVKIVWKSGDLRLIKADGTITQPEYGAGNKRVLLQAILTKGIVVFKKSFKITVLQSEIPQNDQQKVLAAKIEIQKELDKNISTEDKSKKLLLPTKINKFEGLKINWLFSKEERDNSVLIFLIFGVAVLLIIIFVSDNDLNKKIKKRRIELQLDFPDFLNRFTLLINAGITVSRAWIKISDSAKKNSPLYEEIALTVSEIKSGKAEIVSYEAFADRCKIPEITKFVSVIEQNLKKGNKELVTVLKYQANDCWLMRKNAAKQLGEEASTKMLLPLMLMLLAIVLIVATPAAIAMQAF